MAIDEAALQVLLDKEAIRELVLLYSRAIDRQDLELLKDLYTEDATDTHGDTFDGSAEEYCKFIGGAFPFMPYSGHHLCNHLVSVDGDTGCGEAYAIAWHLIPTREGGRQEDLMAVRYIDNYRRCPDGRWRFSKRTVTYDLKIRRPFEGGGTFCQGDNDPSYSELTDRVFARGPRG